MASYQIRQRDPLLDQQTQAMLERRGKEVLGLILLAIALGFGLMLGSYSPNDPGWMVATEEPAANYLGRFGAALASTLIIIGGKGVWSVPIILAAWGVRFMTHRGADRATGRLLFAVLAAALASIYASTLVPGPDWTHSFGLGGLFGDMALGSLLGMIPGGAELGLRVAPLLVGLVMIAAMLFVCGFDLIELGALGRFLRDGLLHVYDLLATATGRQVSRAKDMAREGVAQRNAQPHPAAARADVYAQTSRSHFAAEPQVVASHPQGEGNFVRPDRARHVPVLRADSRPQAAVEYAAATPEWDSPRPLGAAPAAYSAPLAQEPLYAQPREKLGLLARMPALMRRLTEPMLEPELIEPELPAGMADYGDLPDEDRIRSRISDAVRSRTAPPAASLSPIEAAVRRREPALSRPRGPVPLIADTRPIAGPQSVPPSSVDFGQPVPGRIEPALQSAAQTAAMLGAPAAAGLAVHSIRATRTVLDTASAARPNSGDMRNAFAVMDDDEAYEAGEDEAIDLTRAPAPLPSWRSDLAAAPAAPAIDRRPVVQHVVKKQIAPSTRAVAEAQPRLRFDEPAATGYELPPLSLLSNPVSIQRNQLSDEALEENARMLENVLDDYGVRGEIVSVRPGPVVTMYELEPAPGLKASRVIGLADDIARSMSALSARVSTVPGRTVIGIELPNATREKVLLREIIAARDFGDSNLRLPLALGKDIGGDPIVANLAKMPHLLIAGTTGSGKSVAINTMILSLLYKLTPEECRLIMIDPKMLELSVYDGIPHLLSPVVTDPKKAVVALKWVVGEMEERYRKMSKMGVRNIEGYNGRVKESLANGEMFKRTIQTGFDEETGDPVFETDEFAPVALPYIVVVVDEMADLMMVAGKEIEACIQRLAQMARASGIHLIMATQRPSVDVITGTIKANFPTRISFQVTSKIDSRTILGEQGAEQLLGMGDMLYMAGGGRISRIHGPFVSDEEVEEVVNHLKSFGPPAYMSGVVEGPEDDAAADIDAVLGLGNGDASDDSLYDQAVAIVARDRKCSTSYIQRKLGIGYNKAARLVEQMEEQSVVTRANHVGKREILVAER